MELRTYWNVLRRRWWLIVVPVLVVAAHTALTYQPPGPVYQVVMRFAAGTEPAGISEDYDRYYPWLTSEYVANGLADAARTGAFAEAAAARLAADGVEVPAAAIQGAIVTDNAQSILIVYITWADAAQATAIADAVTAELTENSATYYPQLRGVEPAVRRLDAPAPTALAPGLRTQIEGPAIRIGLALVVGVALALLWHYLDPTVHEAAEIEAMGLAVLGTVPRHSLLWRLRRRLRRAPGGR